MGYFSTLPIARFFPRFEGLSRVFLRLNVSFMSHYWIIIMWHLFQHSLSHNHRYQCNEGNWNRSRTAVVTLLVFVTFISITKANIFVFLKVSFENRVQCYVMVLFIDLFTPYIWVLWHPFSIVGGFMQPFSQYFSSLTLSEAKLKNSIEYFCKLRLFR